VDQNLPGLDSAGTRIVALLMRSNPDCAGFRATVFAASQTPEIFKDCVNLGDYAIVLLKVLIKSVEDDLSDKL